MSAPDSPGSPPLIIVGASAGGVEALSVLSRRCRPTSMWAAIRSLEDRSALLERLAHRADGAQPHSAESFAVQARYARESARTIRQVLELPEPGAPA